jgi:hypothetical protein
MSWKDVLKSLLSKQSESVQADSQAKKQKRGVTTSKAESLGIATQFEGTSEASPRKQLIIGLDFGTAFTKVVVGEERFRFAIPLRGVGGNASDYLLPTAFWSSPEGICSIDTPSGEQHADLKMALIEGNASDSTLQDVAIYLALVLRRVRKVVFEKKRDIYGKNHIDWLINVGLPTDSYHDRSLAEDYGKAIGAAWSASAESGSVNHHRVQEILNKDPNATNINPQHLIHHEAISVFPEFVAQVTGYVRSPLRQPDLHLLVDIGAGTLDATVFNVHEQDDEDRFPIFAKGVQPFGTRFLIRHRTQGTSFGDRKEFAPFASVPDKESFAKILGLKPNLIDEKDKPFLAKITKMVGDLLRRTKMVRHPMSPRWSEGVPLFLCGGGANCDFYAELFRAPDGNLAGYPVLPMKLPKPEQLEAEGISGTDYDRISVAYGLSFDPFDIGEIIREDEVEDIDQGKEASAQNTADSSKDIYCPRCRGTGGLHRPCDECGGSGFSR